MFFSNKIQNDFSSISVIAKKMPKFRSKKLIGKPFFGLMSQNLGILLTKILTKKNYNTVILLIIKKAKPNIWLS